MNMLTPYVNTDVQIPKKMMHALTMFEFRCVARRIHSVPLGVVREFLTEQYGKEFADGFKPEYLLSSQDLSIDPQ